MINLSHKVLTSPDTHSLTGWTHSSDKVNDATVGLRVNEFTLGPSHCATTNSLTKSYEVYWVTNCWYLLDTVHWNSITHHELQVSRKWSSKIPVQSSPESRVQVLQQPQLHCPKRTFMARTICTYNSFDDNLWRWAYENNRQCIQVAVTRHEVGVYQSISYRLWPGTY